MENTNNVVNEEETAENTFKPTEIPPLVLGIVALACILLILVSVFLLK